MRAEVPVDAVPETAAYRICVALGLDPHTVSHLSIQVPAWGPPCVTVTHSPMHDKDGMPLAAVLERYQLVPIEPDGEVGAG